MAGVDLNTNYVDQFVQEQLNWIGNSFTKRYTKAWNKIKPRLTSFIESFSKEDSVQKKRLDNNEISSQEYKMWRINKLNNDTQWQSLKKQIAEAITQENKVSATTVNTVSPKVYKTAYNYVNYKTEQLVDIDSDYLDDEDDIDAEYKTLSVNKNKDEAYNEKRITNSLVSSLVVGYTVTKAIDSISSVFSSSKKSAYRNAVTSITSAECCGYDSAMMNLLENGVHFQKKWVSARDSRVRDSHIELDGVMVEPEEPFPNGLYYPKDPEGPPEEVYNCRCTMSAHLDVFEDDEDRYIRVYDETDGKRSSHIEKVKQNTKTVQTYNQWKNSKQKELKYKLNMQSFARKPSDYEEIWISDKQEYANVMSNVRTYATKQQKEYGAFSKIIGDYSYKFVYIKEDDDYRIIGKSKIYDVNG